jgi:hypothetical protein
VTGVNGSGTALMKLITAFYTLAFVAALAAIAYEVKLIFWYYR